ncbi:MAG TPA: NADP-dependent oxidoreductase [Caulobacteraceae bacterium]|jgi:NADPH:quinone reductase-like Zn-dependent oxidoreductase|nr:NADP-dependent oxidoreductase [Caulobacteraceae bacterium]
MKAIRIHHWGGPDVLELEDVPPPQPRDNEVLVRVRASSVNPVDYKIRRGGYLKDDALPLTLGRDVAGTIERSGQAVADFESGDAIYAMLPDDRGGHAELVAIPADLIARKPERLDFVQAAAVPLASVTAWQGLFDHGALKQGQTVLIHGAGGGVGHFAVQFAVVRGARVIATCSGRDRDFVESLGADTVVDYKSEDFRDSAHDVDLVYDLVGGEAQDRSWDCLHEGGVLVSTVGEPNQAKASAHRALGVGYKAQPNGMQLTEIARLIDSDRVTPHIDKVFPLSETAAAERRLETDHVRGKLVLQVAP